jgi:hypothetical protein
MKSNQTKRVCKIPLLLALLTLPVSLVLAQSGGPYDLSWSTVDGGGGASSGGDFTLSGTAGQADAGAMSGGIYGLTGGFWTEKPGNPTAVTLAWFDAHPVGEGVLIEWETATELDNLGFYVYRSPTPEGKKLRLNLDLIPSQMPGSPVGAHYEFVDNSAPSGVTCYYWLEDVDLHGQVTRHGPVQVQTGLLRPVRPRPVLGQQPPSRNFVRPGR